MTACLTIRPRRVSLQDGRLLLLLMEWLVIGQPVVNKYINCLFFSLSLSSPFPSPSSFLQITSVGGGEEQMCDAQLPTMANLSRDTKITSMQSFITLKTLNNASKLNAKQIQVSPLNQLKVVHVLRGVKNFSDDNCLFP